MTPAPLCAVVRIRVGAAVHRTSPDLKIQVSSRGLGLVCKGQTLLNIGPEVAAAVEECIGILGHRETTRWGSRYIEPAAGAVAVVVVRRMRL